MFSTLPELPLWDDEMAGPDASADNLDEAWPDEEKHLAGVQGEEKVAIEEFASKRNTQSVPGIAMLDMLNVEPTIEQAMKGDFQFNCSDMTIHIFKRPDKAYGIASEFGIFELNKKIRNVFIISSGKQGHGTLSAATPYKLTVLKQKGLPSPWKVSAKYKNSAMYWGLNIEGGFWIHSTPHYGELGRPASMGCVRTTHPTSMEIWDTAVNICKMTPQMYIYREQSSQARQAFDRLMSLDLDEYAKEKLKGVDFNDKLQVFKTLIQKDLQDAQVMVAEQGNDQDYRGNGHRRLDTERVVLRLGWTKKGQTVYYPKCGANNCYDAFGVKHTSLYPKAWPIPQ